MCITEFDKGRKSVSVAVKGPITVDDVDVMIRAALDGAGLAFTLEEHIAPERRTPIIEDTNECSFRELICLSGGE